MDENDKNFDDLNYPLILKDEVNSSLNINSEILKIKDLIQEKYLIDKNSESSTSQINLNKNFSFIKSETRSIENGLKKKMSLIKKTISNQETKLKTLYNLKELFDQNKIMSDIIENQQKLIDTHKQKGIELQSNLINTEKKLEKNTQDSRKFLINNNELKNTVSRYVNHNKKLQDNINKLKNDYSQSLTASEINDMIVKIKFYQEENIRLSNQVIIMQKKYESIKNNFNETVEEKNNIFKQIQELNNSLVKKKTILTFNEKEKEKENENKKEKIKDEYLDPKLSDEKINKNLHKEEETSKISTDLEDKINNIFN